MKIIYQTRHLDSRSVERMPGAADPVLRAITEIATNLLAAPGVALDSIRLVVETEDDEILVVRGSAAAR